MDRNIKPGRLAAMAVVLLLFVGGYLLNLYKLQIVEGAAYYEMSQNNIVSTRTVTAARGNILDRYGRVLVSNRSCNNLTINSTELFQDDLDSNAVILQLCNTLTACGDTWIDELPITMEAPFEYVDNMTDVQRILLDAYIDNIQAEYDSDFPDDPTAVELMAFFRSRYKIDNNYDSTQMRIIAGVRYAVNVRHIIPTSDYIFAEDVSIESITRLMEQDLPGFHVEVSYVREYETIYAAHLLGYVGQMDSVEYQTYQTQGYPLNAIVGKSGVELAFESYLHGTDGTAQVTSTANGTVTGTTYVEDPEPGNHVYLTIDIGLQEAAEQALGSFITLENAAREAENEQAALTGESTQELITGGALVAIDVKTGEPLALASYPSYDLATFRDDYNELLQDDVTTPLVNRALSGLYEPGSTYKMCTSIAALDTGLISTGTTITDEVTYSRYADQGYAPSCWIKSSGGSHGTINVSQALSVSCNYFFYAMGDQLGEETMTQYAQLFGFGQNTGIELAEDTGYIATPERLEETQGRDWYAGDNLQAAIGQSVHQFTPIQIANYVATVANGGHRYSTSILKSVRSYDYSEQVYERQPEEVETIETADENWQAVHEGMRGAANNVDGTAYTVFGNYAYCTVAAKTGTAQTGDNRMNNAVFVCYAPYDDPEIAVCVVVEKGAAGASLGNIAKEVLDYYFRFQDSTTNFENEGSLLK